MSVESSPNKIIGPALSTGLLLAPMRNYETLAATGAVRIIDRYSSMFAIDLEEGNPEAGVLFVDGGLNKDGKEPEIYLAKRGLTLSKHVGAIVITHLHFDHMGVTHALPTSVRTIIGAGDVDVQRGLRNSDGPLPGLVDRGMSLIKRPGLAVARHITPEVGKHLQEFRFGELSVKVLETPGHTPGSLGFLIRRGDENQPTDFFPGDTFDFTRKGQIRRSPPIFTGDRALNRQSIIEVATVIAQMGLEEGEIGPAHSGIGKYDALLALAPEAKKLLS